MKSTFYVLLHPYHNFAPKVLFYLVLACMFSSVNVVDIVKGFVLIEN